MAKQTGLTGDTFKRFIMDAGAAILNFDSESTGEGKNVLLGATRGGNVLTLETTLKTMEVDGAPGDVKGDKRITAVKATLTVNLLEHTLALIKRIIAGSSSTAYTPAGQAMTACADDITRALTIALTDYADNIALVGDVSGAMTNGATTKPQPAIFCLKNVLSTGNFEVKMTDKDEAVIPVVFTAHFDPDDLESEPWFIRWPKEAVSA